MARRQHARRCPTRDNARDAGWWWRRQWRRWWDVKHSEIVRFPRPRCPGARQYATPRPRSLAALGGADGDGVESCGRSCAQCQRGAVPRRCLATTWPAPSKFSRSPSRPAPPPPFPPDQSCGDFDVTRLEDGFGVLHPRSQEEEEEDAKAENTSSCIRGVLSSTLLVLVALGLIVLGQQYLGDLLTWFQRCVPHAPCFRAASCHSKLAHSHTFEVRLWRLRVPLWAAVCRSQGFEAKLLYGCLFIPIGFPVFLCGSVLLSMGACGASPVFPWCPVSPAHPPTLPPSTTPHPIPSPSFRGATCTHAPPNPSRTLTGFTVHSLRTAHLDVGVGKQPHPPTHAEHTAPLALVPPATLRLLLWHAITATV